MLALRPDIVEAVWQAVAGHLPEREEKAHPLGCHRRRAPDRDCFEAILFRLVTGCSWDVAGRLGKGGETTLRRRRDEWLVAGVFDGLVAEALHAYDRVIGLDLSEVAIDGSLHKAPCGGEGTGPSPVDRGKTGWKWSIATDRFGIPIGWATDGANRHDSILLPPTLGDVASRGLVEEIETLHLTAAMTTTSCAPTSPVSASTISSPRREHQVKQRARRRVCRSDCAGRSSGRTHAVELRRLRRNTTASSPSARSASLAITLSSPSSCEMGGSMERKIVCKCSGS